MPSLYAHNVIQYRFYAFTFGFQIFSIFFIKKNNWVFRILKCVSAKILLQQITITLPARKRNNCISTAERVEEISAETFEKLFRLTSVELEVVSVQIGCRLRVRDIREIFAEYSTRLDVYFYIPHVGNGSSQTLASLVMFSPRI